MLCSLQAQKVNAKLGGVNVSLISRPIPWMDEPLMVLGEEFNLLLLIPSGRLVYALCNLRCYELHSGPRSS